MTFICRVAIAAALIAGFPPALLCAQDLGGTWQGQLVRDGFTWNAAVHVDAAGGAVKVSLPDWGMFQLVCDSVTTEAGALRFGTAWVNSTFDGRVTGDTLRGTWTFGTRSTPVSLIRVSSRSGILRTEPVSVMLEDGARLEGTLVLPDGDPPYAAMVMTHGSGPDTRSTGPYISKANLAAMNGLAVLVYDKRGAGASTGGERVNDPGRLAADAAAMFARLRADPRVDTTRTGVGGASQGAWTAAELAAGDQRVAFVFTVAAPGLSAAEQNVFSMEARLAAYGVTPEGIRSAKQALRALYDFYRTGAPAARARAVSLIEAPNPDWSEHEIFQRLMFSNGGAVYATVDAAAWSGMFVDPLAWWREVRVPTIAIWGDADINVPARYSRDVIAAALRDAGNTNVELHIFPNAGHGITLENLPAADWPRMAPGYVEAMARWFAARAVRR